jgi:ribosomal protein S18 acetylase RimI-like enzyme
MHIRNIRPADYPSIITVLNAWWGGRRMSDMLPKLFFVHFRETSFIAEDDAQIAGFLAGFFSQTFADEAYIHFVGVHPDYRGQGVGQALYERFFETVREHNRHIVRCVTAPSNKNSIAFHTRMGFQAEAQETQLDGIPYYPDYDGTGEHRVLFVKHL